MKIRRLSIAILFLVTNNTPVWAQLSEFERYEGSKEAELQLIHSLANKFVIVQENSMHDGKKVRGTHAKGTCMDGEFEVFSGISESYKVGLFSTAGTYSARVRFANGSGKIQADSVPDARAISISVLLGNNSRQDFAMNNDPIFPIGELSDFNFLLDVGFAKAEAIKESLAEGADEATANAAGERASKIFIALNPTHIPGFLGTIQRGAELQNQKVNSYRTLKYWSGSTFKFGDHHASKFALTPCAQNQVDQVNSSDPDFLQNDLKIVLSTDSSVQCWDFYVQLLDAENMKQPGFLWSQKLPAWQWVEDVTLDWDKGGATSYKVGRLILTSGSVKDANICDDPSNGINVMKNSLPEHRGLGRINRARALSEESSRANRP